MNAKLVGVEKLMGKLQRLPVAAKRGARIGINRAASLVQGEARVLAPKGETHELEQNIVRKSARTSGDRVTAFVESKSEHSIENEYGTENMAPQPFLRPAVDRVGPIAALSVGSNMKREIESV